MDIIRSLMGRRQFLIATGLASGCALTCKKLETFQLQGPENFLTDVFRNHYSNMAKNAAIVSVDTVYGTYPKNYGDQDDIHNRTAHHSDHNWQNTPPVHNYVNRLIDDIHCEGALVRYSGNLGAGGGMPDGASGGEGKGPTDAGPEDKVPGGTAGGQGNTAGGGFNPGKLRASVSIKDVVAETKELEDQGYDVIGVGGDNFEQDRQSVMQLTLLRL